MSDLHVEQNAEEAALEASDAHQAVRKVFKVSYQESRRKRRSSPRAQAAEEDCMRNASEEEAAREAAKEEFIAAILVNSEPFAAPPAKLVKLCAGASAEASPRKVN